MNRSIKVIDDVVSDTYQHYIEQSVSGLPWEFKDGVSFSEYSHREYDNPIPDVDPNTGFANVVYDALCEIRKPESDFLIPLLCEAIDKYDKGAKLKQIYRIKAGLFIKNQNKGDHLPHIDLDTEHYTMIYYVKDSDGPTRLYKDGMVFKEVHPKKGRALIIPGDTLHSSSSPTETNSRLVLNYNFLI
tara:strand:+ start:405 stop:965 length:561 start_codon:yes stop_codon:yes gene_type:complete